MNVYGIVKDATAVSKTRGSDSKMTLKIYDETTTTDAVVYGSADDLETVPSELSLTFFDRNPYELPRPADGDVIRIHRVQAQNVSRKAAIHREDWIDDELWTL